MADRRSKSVSLGSVLGYSDIAQQMGVDVKSVRIYASRDKDFPAPVTPPEWRSPGFAQQDVDRYLERRRTRGAGQRGRPARGAAEERVQLGPEVGERIRSLLAERRDGATVRYVKDLAPLLGLSVPSVGFRMSGRARWLRSELDTVAAALGASVDELVGDAGAAAPADER
ncbi:hypothetical protein LQK89_17680 (plasmid) [Curtobacterium sp. C1]|uniref:hypothetical protein n=1 Tax=Curtobacterium sp. C1 TaxID=2898151 RepID=UPI001E45BC00|nr:hypothetical protein [Curtobacterium sp. C1]UFU16053.1 hypothetical protein LQK89_17680 [Curtobacterium sp. C1]